MLGGADPKTPSTTRMSKTPSTTGMSTTPSIPTPTKYTQDVQECYYKSTSYNNKQTRTNQPALHTHRMYLYIEGHYT